MVTREKRFLSWDPRTGFKGSMNTQKLDVECVCLLGREVFIRFEGL